jgi:hypothetical protein
MDARLTAVLRELRVLMYSDEGELFGVPAFALWEMLKDDYIYWLVREN